MNEWHGYNVKLACSVGMMKAVLLGRVHFLWEHSKKTERNCFGGRYWMYDSSVALAQMYPYMKEQSIRRHMNELEVDGWIVSGNFNTRKYDKTKWYTLGKKFEEFLLTENVLPKNASSNCVGLDKKSEIFPEIETHAQNERGSEISDNKDVFLRENHGDDTPDIETHAQNERGSESHAHFDKSHAQFQKSHAHFDKSHAQNERPIPVIELSNSLNNSSSSSGEENDDDDPKKEEGNFNDPEFVTERIHRLYLSCFGKMPNSFELSELRKTVLLDEGRSTQENFAIMVQAFHKAALDLKTQNTRYVLGVIRGMKQDLAIAEQKKFKEAEMQKARTEEMRRQQQMKLGLEGNERPRLREMFEDEVMKQKRQAV